MPHLFFKAEADTEPMRLLDTALNKWYQELIKAKLQCGIMFIASNGDSPPLKEAGVPVEGKIKIVPDKDRITKGFDVEIEIDLDEWKGGSEKHRLALLDNLLARLELKKPKKKKKRTTAATHGTDEELVAHEELDYLVNAHGRPQLKKRKSDCFVGPAYLDVMKRHGTFSVEHKNIMRAYAFLVSMNTEQQND